MPKKKLCLMILPIMSFVPAFIVSAYDDRLAPIVFGFCFVFLFVAGVQTFAVKKWVTALGLGLAKNFAAILAFLILLILPVSSRLTGAQLIIYMGVNTVLFFMSVASVYFERKVLIPQEIK